MSEEIRGDRLRELTIWLYDRRGLEAKRELSEEGQKYEYRLLCWAKEEIEGLKAEANALHADFLNQVALRERMEEALKAVEWAGSATKQCCPWCRGWRSLGHNKDCLGQKALKGGESNGG